MSAPLIGELKPLVEVTPTASQQCSKFTEINMFKDVYVRPGNETTKQLHAAMVEKCAAILQESASQLPPEISIEDVTVPEDPGL
ncbi:hypothetical protein C1H46_001158 [Malus baccata]|uniref:Uncharacterized protein n=1 Tax=Malus baccata TaxID=106549 RepID=A0A540NPV9_MALBA|nr:hypothetical protein C1H46_001158 [Malus baccata]